jgi:flagellar hook-associated protein 3 FlgL
MINTLSSSTDRFLADVSNLNQRLIVAQRQVSSGLRMQTVSDDPDQVSALLELKSHIARNDQLKYNLGRAQTEVNSAESAINTATSLMDRAGQIAAQSATNFTSDSTRQQLVNQVSDIITEIYSLTQTQVEGRFVFSGNADQTPPYAGVNASQPNSLGAYQGSANTRVLEHPNGSTFSVSLTANQVFDAGASNTSVLKALTNLRNDLAANNVNAVAVDATDLETSAQYLNGQQALYGDIQNKVADALSFQQQLDTQLKLQLSNLQDADETSAIVEMQKDSIAQQAALQAHAALPHKSLFDYIG